MACTLNEEFVYSLISKHFNVDDDPFLRLLELLAEVLIVPNNFDTAIINLKTYEALLLKVYDRLSSDTNVLPYSDRVAFCNALLKTCIDILYISDYDTLISTCKAVDELRNVLNDSNITAAAIIPIDEFL